VLAFTDADCRPDSGWLETGIAALGSGACELAAGAVRFDLGPGASPAQLTDALWHLDVERQVRERGAAMTSNLFVHRRVIDGIGGFAEVRSGEDGRWTRRAGEAGFRLCYAGEAVVWKLARRGPALLAKGWRTGRGLPRAWLGRGLAPWKLPLAALANARPPRPSRITAQARRRGVDAVLQRPLAVWWWSWLLEVSRAGGAFRGVLDLPWRWREDGGAAGCGVSRKGSPGSDREAG
jgi:hypothetical protein